MINESQPTEDVDTPGSRNALPAEEMSLDKPASAVPLPETEPSVWDELVLLGQEIGRGWRSPLTGPELLSAMRR